MQAIDEATTSNIVVKPTDLSQEEKLEFQPTSKTGVSFPYDNRAPTIFVTFAKPYVLQSVTIPGDRTSGANVQQFEVTFYSPDGKKLNQQPIVTDLRLTGDQTNSPTLEVTNIPSEKHVSRLEITIVLTTDGESPKGVLLDIKACTESNQGGYPKA